MFSFDNSLKIDIGNLQALLTPCAPPFQSKPQLRYNDGHCKYGESKMRTFKVLAIAATLITSNAFAVELIANTKITHIGTSTNGVSDNFFIHTVGDTGPCVGKSIIFKRSSAPSDGFYERLYSTALTAYTTGQTNVRVVNPHSDDCTAASYIDMNAN